MKRFFKMGLAKTIRVFLLTLLALQVIMPIVYSNAIEDVFAAEPLPSPTLLSPANNSSFKTSELPQNQTWSAVGGASTYRYESCRTDPSLNSGICPDDDVQFTFNTSNTFRTIGTNAPEGLYWWRVRAISADSTLGEWSEAFVFFVDNTKPTVQYLHPATEIEPFSGQLEVDFQAEDAGLLNRLAVNLYNESNNTFIEACGSTPASPPLGVSTHLLECNIDTTALADGIYTLRGSASDLAGNTQTISRKFEVDNNAPDVQITNPLDETIVSGTVDLRGTVLDENLWRYYYIITGPSGTVTSQTVYESNAFTDQTFYTWDTALVPDGDYTIRLEARDTLGQKDSGSIDEIQVEVSNTVQMTITKSTESEVIEDVEGTQIISYTLTVENIGNVPTPDVTYLVELIPIGTVPGENPGWICFDVLLNAIDRTFCIRSLATFMPGELQTFTFNLETTEDISEIVTEVCNTAWLAPRQLDAFTSNTVCLDVVASETPTETDEETEESEQGTITDTEDSGETLGESTSNEETTNSLVETGSVLGESTENNGSVLAETGFNLVLAFVMSLSILGIYTSSHLIRNRTRLSKLD